MPVSFCISATTAARRSSALRNSWSIHETPSTSLGASREIVGEDPRLIVLLVARAVEQRHSPGLDQFLQPPDRLRVGAKLSPVAPREFGEAGRVMAEPSPQFRARRNLL